MKSACYILILSFWVAPAAAPAQVESPAAKTSGHPGNLAEALSSTESRISQDRREIKQSPDRFQAYNDLALALMVRARETDEMSFLAEADTALKTALRLSPDNMQVLKTRVGLLLAQHEFVQARAEAAVLNAKMPDDVSLYGYMATADIALGNYEQAETEAQWMLNLLPNNVPGLLIGAQLRQLYGDSEGAIQFLNQAYSETPSSEILELAAIAHRMARVEIGSGHIGAADRLLQQMPGHSSAYPALIEDLADVRAAQGRYEEAIELLMAGNQRRAAPRRLFSLARVLEKARKLDKSRAAYTDFERAARTQIDEADNANRELILYYADGRNAHEALRLARREIKTKQDIFTLDAYAWALCANGELAEARNQIEKALKTGVREAGIFYHAAVIASAQSDSSAAVHYFENLLETNPSSEYASETRKFLLASGATPSVQAPSPYQDSSPGVLPQTQSAVPNISLLKAQNREPASASQSDVPAETLSAPPGVSAPSFSPIPRWVLSPKLTETDHAIQSLQTKIAHQPNQYKLYAQLGAAFFQKARETGDVTHFVLAERALRQSLDLISNDMAAAAPTEIMAEVYMGEHRFADALTFAEKALSLGAGDVSPFAIVGDAYADMGEYDKAMDAYARLQSIAGRDAQATGAYARDSRISFLKFVSGDTDAAIRLMQSAIANGIAAQLPSENLAWLYYELGEYCFQNGDPAGADHSYLTALAIHPGDYRALAGLAKVRATQGLYSDAIELYQKAMAVVPMPLFAAELGDVYAKVGRQEDAIKQFRLVEYIGKLGAINQALHNRDLAVFYADHDINLRLALALARKEFEVRHDIYTWDVLAWTLYKNNELTEAAAAIEQALRFNTKDALLLFHAGTIYQGLGKQKKAREYLTRAIAINPKFHVVYAETAARRLAEWDRQSARVADSRGVDDRKAGGKQTFLLCGVDPVIGAETGLRPSHGKLQRKSLFPNQYSSGFD